MNDLDIDRLIAQHLMGWTWEQIHVCFPNRPCVDEKEKWVWCRRLVPPGKGSLLEPARGDEPVAPEFQGDEPIVRYSSTGDGMLLVIEAMRENGYDCKILLLDYAHILFQDPEWDSEEFERGDGPHWVHENPKDPMGLPRVVSLAALRALGVPLEEPRPPHDCGPSCREHRAGVNG